MSKKEKEIYKQVNRPAFDWLNEESKLFLQRGYLLEGTTAKERIRQIAETAEEILGKKGFADKFYDYMGKGWFSLSSPIWSNFGLDRGLSISCVTGDTWINTINGGKQAKDIKIGDLVLTHKNRFKKVTNVIPSEKKKDIYKLKVGTRMTNLYITGNHPVLTNLGWVKVEDLDIKKHLIAVNGDLEYEAKDYTIDLKPFIPYKFIVEDGKIKKAVERYTKDSLRPSKIANNLAETHVTSYAQPFEKIEVDEDLAWALGLWFAEGSLSTNAGKPNGIRITLNTDEEDLAQRWLKIITSKFNLNGKIFYGKITRNGKLNTWININVNSVALGSFFASFGKGCKEKEMPDWLINLPKEKLEQVLKGLLDGDGSIAHNICKMTLANPKLILQAYLMGLKTGKEMSLQMQEKAGVLASVSHTYMLTIRAYVNARNRTRADAGVKFHDGLVYCPIKTLEKTDRVEDVYDFTVEDDHSFSCAGVVVHNCFSSYCPDSISGIMGMAAEVGMMSKIGGGTSGYFGDVRPRGSVIKNNGKSDGSFSFLKIFDTVIDCVSQGKSRRGQFAAYIDIDHGDIEEWLDIHTEGNPIQLMYYGVCVSHEWLKAMKEGDENKRRIWAKVLQRKAETGIPYIFFTDNANNQRPDVYKDLNLYIKNSNLCCFTGDTVIAVADGRNGVTIKQLAEENERFNVYSARKRNNRNVGAKNKNVFTSAWKPEIKSAIAFSNGFKPVVELTLSDGSKFKCTEDHLLATIDGEWIQAKDALNQELESLFTFTPSYKKSPYRNINSITNAKSKQHIMIWENENGVVSPGYHVDHIEDNGFDGISNLQVLEASVHRAKTAEKFKSYNPVNRMDNNHKKALVSNQQKGMRNITYSGYDNYQLIEMTKEVMKNENISCYRAYEKLIEEKGFPKSFSNYRFNKKWGDFWDYCNGVKTYQGECEPVYEDNLENIRLNSISEEDRYLLEKENSRIKYLNNTYYEETDEFLKRKGLTVISIESKGVEEVFDLNVEDNHNFYILTKTDDEKYLNASGVLVHNCEIMLPVSEKESFVCCLSSMNLLHYDEWKDTDAPEVLTWFLDAVLTDFIEKAKNVPYMEKAVRFSERHRALGLGVLGWHSYLQSHMIDFDSFEALMKTTEIFQLLQEKTLKASKEMAKELGEPALLEGYGRRNTTLMAIAPTKSSSFILGGVSPSIEPFKSNYYVKDLAKIKTIYKNPFLVKLLQEKGLDTEEVWDSILNHDGSVQHLQELSQHEKNVFKTFSEISQRAIIDQAAERQKYVDQGQSLNLMIHPETPTRDVNQLYLYAEEVGIKSIYYQYSISAAQAFNRDLLTCSNCEA